MIDDIAKELVRVRRDLRLRAFRLSATVSGTASLPEWMIEQALRIEVNEVDFMDAVYRARIMLPGQIPDAIMGVRVYLIGQRYPQLPAPGWRIINPFVKKESVVG